MTIIIHHYIFLKIIGYRVQKQCFQVQDPWSLYDDILTFFRIRALKWTHFSSQFLLPVKILSRTVCDAWSFKQRYWSTSIIACYGVRSLQCYRPSQHATLVRRRASTGRHNGPIMCSQRRASAEMEDGPVVGHSCWASVGSPVCCHHQLICATHAFLTALICLINLVMHSEVLNAQA